MAIMSKEETKARITDWLERYKAGQVVPSGVASKGKYKNKIYYTDELFPEAVFFLQESKGKKKFHFLSEGEV